MSRRQAAERKILWGRTARGPTREGDATCYGCGEGLVVVRESTKRVAGRTVVVRAHYRHRAATHRSTCSHESIAHKAAKHALVLYDWTFTRTCSECGHVIEIYPSGKPHEEVRWQEYVLDVGYLQDDGEVGFAAEVYVTHRIGDDKADALDIHDMPFVEVCAASVLESIETKTVHALRSNRVSCAECIHVNMTCEAKIYDEMHAASTDADAQATAASARDAKSKLDALIATSQQMRAVLDQSDANALARGHGLNVQELEAFMKARNVQMRAPTLRFFETKGDSLRRVDYGKYKGRFYDDVFSAHTVRADRVYMARVLAGVLSDGSDRIEYTYAPPPLHLKQRAREALADAHVCCRCLQDVCACAGS